ncbi:MAG TPA: DUF4013 domain-containing protein [Anaerolineae bacterium]|nr:DUF4013 domain-containing protein [Anaerolineae bacterium]
MDIGKSFGYVFEDKKWIEKVLIGGLVSIIPILGHILLLGYFVELVRNVRQHQPEPLPEWDNWGEKLAEGVKLLIIMLVWSLPLIILFFVAFVPLFFATDSDSGTFLSIILFCFNCLLFLYAIVVALAAPSITIRFAETGELGAGFQIGDILAFTKEHVGQILLVVIVSWVVYMIAGLVGMLLCGIGLLFTMFWAGLVYYHMVGQIGLTPAPAPAQPETPLKPIPEPEAAPELPEPEAKPELPESPAEE